MRNCEKCKWSNVDYVFDDEIGEEYPVYVCVKCNDTEIEDECADFKEYKPRQRKEKATDCDKCEHFGYCKSIGNLISVTGLGDNFCHYIGGETRCLKRGQK